MNCLAHCFLLPIRLYRKLASPMLGCHCRFVPSCSLYAEEAICRHGILHGLRLSTWRMLRCQPFGGSGFDPVPEILNLRSNSARRPLADYLFNKVACKARRAAPLNGPSRFAPPSISTPI